MWFNAQPCAMRITSPPCGRPWDAALSGMLDAAIVAGDMQAKAILERLAFGEAAETGNADQKEYRPSPCANRGTGASPLPHRSVHMIPESETRRQQDTEVRP